MRLSLLAALCALVASAAAPESTDDLQPLISKAQIENKACDGDYQKAKAAGGELQTEKDPEGHLYFANTAKTLRVAQLMKRYRGASPSEYEVMRQLIEKIERAKGPVDLGILFHLRGCHSIGYYQLGKALLESARHHHLDAAGTAAVREAVMHYVRSDIDQPLNLVELMIRIALLQQLEEARLVTPSGLADLRAHSETLRNEVDRKNGRWKTINGLSDYRKLASDVQADLGKNMAEEYHQTAALRDDLRRLLATIP